MPESLQQPVWHLVVLMPLTFYMYIFFWAYKTWVELRREALLVLPQQPLVDESSEVTHAKAPSGHALSLFRNINPILRTIGLFVPFLQIYILSILVLGIANLVPKEDSFPRKHPVISCGLVVGAFFGLASLSKLPQPYYMLALFAPLVLGFVQHWLNQYWVSVEPENTIVRHGFNGGEMFAIITGAIILGAASAGTMIGVRLH